MLKRKKILSRRDAEEMKNRPKVVVSTKFNYARSAWSKRFVIAVFVGISMLLISLIGETAIDHLSGIADEAIVATLVLLVSWFSCFVIGSKVYKLIFLKKVTIIEEHGQLKLFIDQKETVIKKSQIRKIVSKITSSRGRYGSPASYSSKLILYTTHGTFHFTIDHKVPEIEKVKKCVPNVAGKRRS